MKEGDLNLKISSNKEIDKNLLIKILNKIIFWENYEKIGFSIIIEIIELDKKDFMMTHLINLLYYNLIESNIQIKFSFTAYHIFINNENEYSFLNDFDKFIFIIKSNNDKIIHYYQNNNIEIEILPKYLSILNSCCDIIYNKLI